jgi:hypothetical protein
MPSGNVHLNQCDHDVRVSTMLFGLPIAHELEHQCGLIGHAVVHLPTWLLGLWWLVLQGVPHKHQVRVRLYYCRIAAPAGEARVFYRLQFDVELHGRELSSCN